MRFLHPSKTNQINLTNNALQVVKRTRAAPQIALGEVIQVNPSIRGVLFALDHRGRSVVCARILCLGFTVHDAGPD